MPFDDLLGNPHCVRILRFALQRNRLPHALLFSGPDAVGKRLLAKHLALALNCTKSGPADWCGTCAQCRLIVLGNHPDVYFIAPDGQFIKIEQVRYLIREAYFMPFQGRFKVFVLDEAHRLHPAAANALLKILEEPPLSSKLVLVTPQSHALLPTIRSRCQALRFSPLREPEIERILREHYGLDAQEASLRAGLAEGSVGRAIALDLKRQEFLSKSAALFLEMAIRNAALGEASELAAKISKERGDTEEWLRELFRRLQFTVHVKVKDEDSDPVAKTLTLPQLDVMAHAADEFRRRLDHNINRTLALESLYLRFSEIARLSPMRGAEEI